MKLKIIPNLHSVHLILSMTVYDTRVLHVPLVLNRCCASFLQVFREIMEVEFFIYIYII